MKVRKSFYVEERLEEILKDIAINESCSQTQVYNEFIEFAMFAYKLTKHQGLDLNEMSDIFRKGVIHYVSEQNRDGSNNSDMFDVRKVFD
jgi:hypothetical protein